ncbi:MAG: type 4a pilus biogenesis protein PilO [Patescibacteria group bacterium]
MSKNLLSAIIASVSVLVFFLLVLPTFDQTRMLRSSIGERADILNEAQEISDRINSLNQEIDSRRQNIDKLDRLLPKKKQVPELLSSMESIVSASGTTLIEMNLSDVVREGNVKKISATLKLNGDFASFMNFLDLLERNLRLIDVSNLDVAAQQIERTKTINYDVRFEMNYLSSK